MPAERKIVSVAIYPSIGVARVGNSPGEFFYSPEVPGAEPIDADRFRDGKGRIKRQAARFRLYGLDADGEVVREITAKDAEITWTVHVANTKAAWFQFDQAMDIPASEGKVVGVPPTISALRNPQVNLGDRGKLVIDPGLRTIAGVKTNAQGRDKAFAFDTGEFSGKPVYLGELRTDEDGRLIFLGGRGLAGSIDDVPVQPGQFANTPGWHDDIADGPVDAVIKIGGRKFHAVGAWVLSAPPDYAPGIPAFITGYDLIFEVATKLSPGLAPVRRNSRSISILSCRGSRGHSGSTPASSGSSAGARRWISPGPTWSRDSTTRGRSRWHCVRPSSTGSARRTTPSCRPTPGPGSTATR